jgi:hypothetical protein
LHSVQLSRAPFLSRTLSRALFVSRALLGALDATALPLGQIHTVSLSSLVHIKYSYASIEEASSQL